MKPKKIFLCMFVLLFFANLAPLTAAAAADDAGLSAGASFVISTIDSRPLSIDKLLYTAFMDIGYKAVVKSAAMLQVSYEMANIGERDAVISSADEMEVKYPHLIKVPVALERNNMKLFSYGTDSGIRDWAGLAEQRAGILTQWTDIQNSIPESTEIIIKENTSLLWEGLMNGEYDVVVLAQRLHEEIVLPPGIKYNATLSTNNEYLYVHERHADLVPRLTDALKTIFSDGRGEKILNDISVPGQYDKKTVLHIISSNTEVTREDQFSAKLRDQFKNDASIEWYSFALNSRRFSMEPNRVQTLAQLLRQDCVSRDITAIVVSGESALEFIMNYYMLFFRNTPVFFYGTDNSYISRTQDYESHFTGIIESISAYDTASLALKIFPDTRKIFVVNDYSHEGTDYRASIEAELNVFEDKLEIEYNENVTRAELMAQIEKLPSDSIVLLGSYFNDANAQYYSQNDMARALETHCNVPVFTVYSMDSGSNTIGGKFPDYSAYGEAISNMLRKLIDGVDITNMHTLTDSGAYNNWFFNKSAMNKWNIKTGSLPGGAQIFNEKPSIWESDPALAYAMLALILLGILFSVGITIFLNIVVKQKANLKSARELLAKDEKLREVKDRLERIINTAPLAFVLTIDGVVAETNEYIEKHIGIKPGDNILKYYANPEDRNWILTEVLERSRVENRVVSLVMPHGGAHRFLANISDIEYEGKNGFILWAMDSEERERQQDDLQAARENLQTVLDLLPMPIGIANADDSLLTYANMAMLDLFSLPSLEAVCGRPMLDFILTIQPDGVSALQKMGAMDNEKPVSAEITCVKSGGESFESLITVCRIDYKGKKSLLGIVKDLTAEKEYSKMLKNTADKEKEANMLKSRFLVNMSHEIRTPMNAIIGLTEIELRKNPAKSTRDIYSKINNSAKNLLQIVNDILDISKIEANKIELFDSEFDIEEVISSALLVATPRLDGKDVEFLVNMSLDLPRCVIGDRTRLWQILKNFLDNAAKYTENGKIVLSVFADSRRSDDETVYLMFIVEDTGIGIDDEQLRKLFMPYMQIYNDAQRKYAGSGLGMVISKRLCEIMGGELRVESKLGVGTSIYISLPFKRVQDAKTELQEMRGTRLNGMKILAVDDDEISLGIMETLLIASGASCVLARDGKEALKIVFEHRSRGETFDLILLDYMMHGISGFETARRIQLGLSKAPKLLLVTAYQRLLLNEDIQSYGIDDVIEKPFIPAQFVNKICSSLNEMEPQPIQTKELPRYDGVRVLLFEDYLLNQEVAFGMFSQFGVTSVAANNGKEGIDILNADGDFDLIFMDLQMPVMDGYEATRIIRAEPKFDNIPIISLSADAMKEVAETCREAGMDDHVSKPIEFESLEKIFVKWLPESKRTNVSAEAKTEQHVQEETAVPEKAPVQSVSAARFGGDQEQYEKSLKAFAGELPDIWPDFESAILDPDTLRQDIHKIKGAAGNLSEMDIFQCAGMFESSLLAGRPEIRLYALFTEVCTAFKERVSSNGSKLTQENKPLGTLKELSGHLDALSNALAKYSPRATSAAVKLLREKSWPLVSANQLEKVCELAGKYEFDAALEEMTSMRGELDG